MERKKRERGRKKKKKKYEISGADPMQCHAMLFSMLCDADGQREIGNGMYKRVNVVWAGRSGQTGVHDSGGGDTVAWKAVKKKGQTEESV